MVASNVSKPHQMYVDPSSLLLQEDEEGANLLQDPNNNNNTTITLNNNTFKDVTANNIGEFYRDADVFITGATGFVGKALLEKLLRSCDTVANIYILVRPKRGLGVEQRLKEMLNNPVFDKLREKTPQCFEKIKAIAGDVSHKDLGLNETDKKLLEENVNIVFHSAATVR